jgi:hypothetical protein
LKFLSLKIYEIEGITSAGAKTGISSENCPGRQRLLWDLNLVYVKG